MALAIDILKSFVIARPRVEIDRGKRPLLEIVANIADLEESTKESGLCVGHVKHLLIGDMFRP